MDILNSVEAEWLEITASNPIRAGEKVYDYHQRVLARCKIATAENVRAYLALVEQAWNEPKSAFIQRVIADEEKLYYDTLARGRRLLTKELGRLAPKSKLSGERVFFLKATHGLDADIIEDVCRAQGFSIDKEGYERLAKEHSENSKRGKFKER